MGYCIMSCCRLRWERVLYHHAAVAIRLHRLQSCRSLLIDVHSLTMAQSARLRGNLCEYGIKLAQYSSLRQLM